MLVAAITGKRQATFVEKPTPRATGDLVVVQIRATPMCTEYKAYADGRPTDALGHEAAGEVVEVAQPCRVKRGDRVVVMPQYACGRCALCLAGDYIHCEHGRNIPAEIGQPVGTATYAPYVIKPDWLLLPLPDDMSYLHGSMACCGLGATFGAMQALQVDAFDTVLLTGMGPVGLGGVINATARGARVIAVEGHPYRQRLARELGAEVVLDPADDAILPTIMGLTQGIGVDKAVECSGTAPAQRLLINAARRRGHVAFVGEAGALEIDVSRDMIRKGLTLRGSWHWNMADTPRILQVIRASGAKLDRFITHTLPLQRVGDAWDLQLTGACGKVVLTADG